jgi:drug/metabolite transporter (DMT)-like permease
MSPSLPPSRGPSSLPSKRAPSALSSPLLAWFFVSAWGCGYIASKTGLQFTAPFTFLTLRFAFGLLLLVPLAWWWQRQQPLRWPASRDEWVHVIVAGLLMHAANLGASHYAQYLGMSAGVTALILATQPLVTAFIAAALMGERLRRFQWLGVVVGLIGVALVVWHKIDVRAITLPALLAVLSALTAITIGTLYQRHYCPQVDLRSASVVQFGATLVAVAPLAVAVEGFEVRWDWALLGAIAFLVIFSSILGVNALHTLMRRGEATRVTSLLYLTPIFAVALEWLLFSVVPTALTGLGIAVTCAGVALVAWQPRRAEEPQR